MAMQAKVTTATAVKLPEIPECAGDLARYGVKWAAKPHYVLLGLLKTPLAGRVMGVLAFAGCEIHAHILKKRMSLWGMTKIEKTKYHPSLRENPGCKHFDVDGYFNEAK